MRISKISSKIWNAFAVCSKKEKFSDGRTQPFLMKSIKPIDPNNKKVWVNTK